jgi:hypothetical protein
MHADYRRAVTGGRPRSGTMPAFIDLPARNFPLYKFSHPWEHAAEAVESAAKCLSVPAAPLGRPRLGVPCARTWRLVCHALRTLCRRAHARRAQQVWNR